MTKVLFVVSAATGWTLKDGSVHPTGYWAEELAEPHRIFTGAGWDITIATPGGIAPTVDELSLGVAGGLPKRRKEIRAYLDSMKGQLDHPVALADVDESEYDVVFYPGGHAPMEDLAVAPISGALLTRRLASGKTLALLCHAPAAVLAAKEADGSNAFAGKAMTGLSNVEERFNPFAWKAKWFLQTALVDAGIDYSKATLPFRSNVVVDSNLYTGQNPQSAKALAERIVQDVKSAQTL